MRYINAKVTKDRLSETEHQVNFRCGGINYTFWCPSKRKADALARALKGSSDVVSLRLR